MGAGTEDGAGAGAGVAAELQAGSEVVAAAAASRESDGAFSGALTPEGDTDCVSAVGGVGSVCVGVEGTFVGAEADAEAEEGAGVAAG